MSVLQPLNLPPYPFKITESNGQYSLFDELRKRNIIITPEEWVRQHFVQYLIRQKGYPKALIGLEGGMTLNGTARRTDILVHNNQGAKVLLVECKAPTVAVTQAVFDQVARYNMVHKVPLLAVTNGLQHYYCAIDLVNERYSFLKELPPYAAM